MELLTRLWQKKWYILILELLCILLFGIYALSNYNGISSSFSGEEFSTKMISGEELQGNYLDVTMAEAESIVSPQMQLDKGVYSFSINYTSTENIKAGIAFVKPRDNKKIIFEIPLIAEKTNMNYQFVVSEDCQVFSYARLTGDATEGNYILINSLKTEQKQLTVIREIAILVAFFLLIDVLLILCLYCKRISSKQEKIIAISLALLAFVVGIPLYQELMVDCVDLQFHLMRIEGLYEGMLGGQFPVKLQPGWLNGYGYAVSVFYGDILLYFPALLRILGFTLSEAFKAYAVGINIATILVAYYCFHKIFGDKLAALTGTILYVGSMNRLAKLYDSAQIGAFSAMLFYPIIILSLYNLLFTDTQKNEYKKNWIYLVIGFSGLLHTHIISCLMIGSITIIMLLIYIKRVLRREPLLELLKALLIGIFLNAWFLIPFLSYCPTYMRMETVDNYNIEHGVYLAKFCNETHNFSSILSNEGIGYSLTAVLFIYLLMISFKQKGDINRMWIGFSLLTIAMSMNIFPYITISKISPFFITIFRTIQSAERFLSVAVLFLSCLGCVLIKNIQIKKEYIYILIAVLCSFTLYQNMIYLDGRTADAVYTDIADLGINATGNGEYIPVGTRIEELSEDIIFDNKAVNVNEWNKEYLNISMTAQNIDTVEQEIALPLLYYNGYRAIDVRSGQKLQTVSGEKIGCPSYYLPNIRVILK